MTRADLAPLWRVLELWRGRAGWLATGLVVTVAALAAGIGLSVLAGAGVAAVALGGVFAAPLLFRLLGPLRVGLRYAERMVTHAALFRALADLRVWFFAGLARRAAGGLGFRRAGDVLARLVGDVEALDAVYMRVLLPLCCAALLVPVLLAVIGHAQPALALSVVLLFGLAAFVLPARAARDALEGGRRLTAAEGGLRVAALDALGGLREVRAFAAEGRMLALIQAREAAMLAGQHDIARRVARAGAAAFLCGQAALLAVLLTAGAHPAEAVAAFLLTAAAFEVALGLPKAGVLAGRAIAAAARVVETADGPIPVPDPAHPVAPPAGHALRFEGVGFRWAAGAPLVLDGLTLDVPEGMRVAILGPSGAGKSTLAALLLRVAVPEVGAIRLGGVDIASMNAADLRARIAWLSQATHLFDDTIRANLLLGRPDADEPALWAALEAARIADLVRGLPHGLDSQVGEAGNLFSGGQGRRLALARALLSPAPVLLLDEPCAGLDAETEREFFAVLNETAQGRTVIIIAHRLTGAERLDRIFRLSAGHAVAAAG